MESLCRISIVVVALFHIGHIVWPGDMLLVHSLLTAIVFVCGFPQQSKGFKRITLVFLLTGSAIMIGFRLSLEIWMVSLVSMTNVIAIIVVMQLFTLPIELGEYSKTITYWLKRAFKVESRLFLSSMAVTLIFATFLLFGTVPVMVSLLSSALKDSVHEYKRFLAAAIVRGYAMAVLWAPGALTMLLVLQITQVSWFALLLPGLLLSLLGIGTSYLFEHTTRLNKPLIMADTTEASSAEGVQAVKQSIHIICVVVGLVLLVGTMEALAFSSGTGRILLAGLIVAGSWLLYYFHHKKFSAAFGRYWGQELGKTTDLAVFFIAIGLFAGAVDKSGILLLLQPLLQQGVNLLGMGAVIAMPVIFIMLAAVGIHPFILVVIMGKIMLALALPLPPLTIALLLLLASAISFIVSPFAGIVLMTSKFLQVKPTDVAIKWNAAFCALFLVEGITFSCLWR